MGLVAVHTLYCRGSAYRLVGLVVKTSASGVQDPGFDSCLRREGFSGWSHTSDFKSGTPNECFQTGVFSYMSAFLLGADAGFESALRGDLSRSSHTSGLKKKKKNGTAVDTLTGA